MSSRLYTPPRLRSRLWVPHGVPVGYYTTPCRSSLVNAFAARRLVISGLFSTYVQVSVYFCVYRCSWGGTVVAPAALAHLTIFSVSETVISCVVHGWSLRCSQLLRRVHLWYNPYRILRFAGVARAARYCRVSWVFPVVPGRLLSVSDIYICHTLGNSCFNSVLCLQLF